MAKAKPNLKAAVEKYFTDVRRIDASGGATPERSYYTPLVNLLNEIGATLTPKVFSHAELARGGSGSPDAGLYNDNQMSHGTPREGQKPERGVIEAKSVDDDVEQVAESGQVGGYLKDHGLVLVTSLREFRLLEIGDDGEMKRSEKFSLANDAETFRNKLQKPRAFADEAAAELSGYLGDVLSHRAPISDPKDLARILARYARTGLKHAKESGKIPSLVVLREALEEALGIKFSEDEGTHFFLSTLIQTLFYGTFSAWVLWARSGTQDKFDWRRANWYLHVPVLQALFQQLSQPDRLRSLDLVDVLDWTNDALARVNQDAFFKRFDEGEAVQYFYEPFLEAFDPELREDFGVWYTPIEVVQYMVARVDRALKDDLGIAKGLAGENVYILDPCCGTGAYLVEVLRRIETNLKQQGAGALAGEKVKQAVLKRVFGFEIIPAPLVIAHLQVGLVMQDLGAPLNDEKEERANIILTNALTRLDPSDEETPLISRIPELRDERERADDVKQQKPILVILGNPPYDGFAGVAANKEERELTKPYRVVRHAPPPTGRAKWRGLKDLYVRFFRMAERRIAEKTEEGVICFISNYSWLDGISFPGMRERYLDVFDIIRIDCLNGDKFKTGKTTSDGSPDPSIFSTESDPVGIQVGTAITTLIRKKEHKPTDTIGLRNLWGQTKRQQLLESSETPASALYKDAQPVPSQGSPFIHTTVSDGWAAWPSLPDLFSTVFFGVQTNHDSFLVDIDLKELKDRVADYFNPGLNNETIAQRHSSIMKDTKQFNGGAMRDALLKRGGPDESGFVKFAYRPFDIRWLYYEEEKNGLLGSPSPGYRPHVFGGNIWLVIPQRQRKEWSPPLITSNMGDLNHMDSGAAYIFLWLRGAGAAGNEDKTRRANLTQEAQAYLKRTGVSAEELFFHVLATLHDPAYRENNAGALRMNWPRIPFPGWNNDDDKGAAQTLVASVDRGRQLAVLLDPETSVAGVTEGGLREELADIAVPTPKKGDSISGDDLRLAAGWGHFGANKAVMPGRGQVKKHDLTPEEKAAMGDTLSILGSTTLDICLNDNAFWKNVPAAVWNYKLGGYPVLKKWLSYREFKILERPLTADEVQHFTDTARRIAAILLLTRKRDGDGLNTT